MRLKDLSKEDIEKLYRVLRTLFQARNIFSTNQIYQEKTFEIQKLSIFKNTRANDGMPSDSAIGSLQFNFKPWFEFLDTNGIIEILKNPMGFKNWKITTNLYSIKTFQEKVIKTQIKPIKWDRNFAFESILRDIINNEIGTSFPVYPKSNFKIPNLLFRREEIEGINGDCDIVGKDAKNNEIKLFIEITTGAIESGDKVKQSQRRNISKNAMIWFIGSRINQRVFNDLMKDKNTIVSLIPNFIEKYPILSTVY